MYLTIFIFGMDKKRVLFIIKERNVYGIKSASYGLVNSAQFVVNALIKSGIEAKVVQVIDSNGIDKAVFDYSPTHCFIEALWVTPSKFVELAPLHPSVKWIVRIHSMIPFLVSEGMCFGWINEYQKLRMENGIDISVSCNNDSLYDDLNSVYDDVSYTPNIYDPDYNIIGDDIFIETEDDIINVGAFGALRLLKNHCQQAFWAIQFANKINKKLHFHVNVSEHETNQTSPVLKNLKAIFKDTNHKLIEHTWMPHEDFIELVKKMDFGMQLSFTETFNIVAADFVGSNVPIIVSNEIDFVNCLHTVNISNPIQVLIAMYIAYYGRKLNIHKINNYLLNKHNKMALNKWICLLS
jgi:hypothetical protein